MWLSPLPQLAINHIINEIINEFINEFIYNKNFMVVKIGKIAIGLRLFISLIAIAITYGYIGIELYQAIRLNDYAIAAYMILLAILGIVAIPQSLGGLLAAIAAIVTVYFKSNLNYSLITACVCLGLYFANFNDLRYEAQTDKKLSIWEIIATMITIAITIQGTILISTKPITWLTSVAIGAIAAAITLVGKQLLDTDLPAPTIWKIFAIVTGGSMAIGFVIRWIFPVTRVITY